MHDVPKTIIAATDFSDTADRAVAMAANLCRRFSAELHILHVKVLLEDPLLEDEQKEELERLAATGDGARLKVLENSPGGLSGVVVTPHLVRGIAPDEVIIETASSTVSDLVVMGTTGRKGLRHLLLGSVAEKVVRTAEQPVLTVRADARINPEGIRTILVPHDFSEPSIAAVRVAAAWARALAASVTLFHAIEPVVYPEFYSVDIISDDMMGLLSSRSESALNEVGADLLTDVDYSVHVEVGRAADTITRQADPDHFDLVVMGTRGLSAIEHLLLGSVAENVLRRCQVPLLTVRSADPS